MKKTLVFCLIVLINITLSSCSKHLPVIKNINGKTMGTTYSVMLVSTPDENMSLDELKLKIDKRLQEINQLMSTYIADSELSLLNLSPAAEKKELSDETLFVIKRAVELHALSHGMLDITVGPLVNLWGFGPEQRPNKTPSAESIDEVRKYVGIDKFTLEGKNIVKQHDKVYIDLSTIAKGYAVDQISELLLDLSIDNFLVEIGGEMRVSGTKPNHQNWFIAIEKPISGQRAVQKTLSVTDAAIASSGDYRNYFEEDGKRYSHLINPNTAMPIGHNLVSVTVVANTAIDADGLATALIVLGAEKGLALAEKENIAALFISKDGDKFIEQQSSEFAKKVKILP